LFAQAGASTPDDHVEFLEVRVQLSSRQQTRPPGAPLVVTCSFLRRRSLDTALRHPHHQTDVETIRSPGAARVPLRSTSAPVADDRVCATHFCIPSMPTIRRLNSVPYLIFPSCFSSNRAEHQQASCCALPGRGEHSSLAVPVLVDGPSTKSAPLHGSPSDWFRASTHTMRPKELWI
jgi:hypothetical protein